MAIIASNIYRPSSVWAWAFLMTACLQSASAIIIDCVLLYKFNERLLSLHLDGDTDITYTKQQALRTAPTYLVILVLGSCYHPLLAWDTLRLQSVVQMIAVCIFGAAIFGYSLVQALQIHNTIEEIRSYEIGFLAMSRVEDGLIIALPLVIAVTATVLCFIAWRLVQVFAWTVYKDFSADIAVKRRYMLLQVGHTTVAWFKTIADNTISFTSPSSSLTFSSSSASRFNFLLSWGPQKGHRLVKRSFI